jgi:hypothetical protein
MSHLNIDAPFIPAHQRNATAGPSVATTPDTAGDSWVRAVLEGPLLIGLFVILSAGALYLRAKLGFIH